MAYLLGEPTVQQYFDVNGDPLFNGSLEFYYTGTTNPALIAFDSEGLATASSVSLNALGAPISAGGTPVALHFNILTTYKIIKKDSFGNIINPVIEKYNVSNLGEVNSYLESITNLFDSLPETFDSINSFLDSTPLKNIAMIVSYHDDWQSTNIGPKGSFYIHRTGATNLEPTVGSPLDISTIGIGDQLGYYFDAAGNEWKLSSQELNLFMFGAKGNGIDTDTVYIQRALDYINQNDIGEIKALSGTYLTSNISWPGNSLKLIGEGTGYSYGSNVSPKTILKAVAGCTIVLDLVTVGGIGDPTGNKIENIEIDGSLQAQVGIDVSAANIISGCRIRNCLSGGIRLSNFTNGTKIQNCGLNQNFGWGLLAQGVSTTTYSVNDTNCSLNQAGGVNLETGNLVKFTNCVLESNSGPGLRIYKPNSHTNAMEGFEFKNVWIEDNAVNTPNYSLVIDAGTGSPTSGPQRIQFDMCRFSVPENTRPYANIAVGKWIEFNRCQWSNSTETQAVRLTNNVHFVSLINGQNTAAGNSLSPTQIESTISQGYMCWWHDTELFRQVGSGSPSVDFENSWINYGSGFENARYFFDRDGKVVIEGQVKSGTVGQAIFTLPTAYRPARQKSFSSDGNGAHSLIYINTNGTVVANVGNNSLQSLNGIIFNRI